MEGINLKYAQPKLLQGQISYYSDAFRHTYSGKFAQRLHSAQSLHAQQTARCLAARALSHSRVEEEEEEGEQEARRLCESQQTEWQTGLLRGKDIYKYVRVVNEPQYNACVLFVLFFAALSQKTEVHNIIIFSLSKVFDLPWIPEMPPLL